MCRAVHVAITNLPEFGTTAGVVRAGDQARFAADASTCISQLTDLCQSATLTSSSPVPCLPDHSSTPAAFFARVWLFPSSPTII